MRRTVYFALGMIIAVAAFAQERSGRIVGRVTDPAGLPVAGVRIRAVNVATGLTREAASGNADGAYLIPALPPGVYQLEASRDGFAPLVRAGVQVDVDQAARADLQLSLASSAESITVTADALQVNTVNAVGGALVGRKQIEGLPLNGRNFIQLGTLVPGAVPVPSRYEVQGIQPARNGFAVNGLRTQSNSFLLDGVTNTDPNFNGYVATPPPDALEQFRIVTGTFSAEYGSSAGSTVSAITRSGTNEFHARAWNFLRNDALDARDFFARSRPPLRQNQFGGTAGGRIFRDRTFYFGYFEGLEARTGTTQNVVAPTSAERGGDFSGSAQPPRDPAAGNAPFPNAQIPRDRLSPIATKLLQDLVPLPNSPGNRLVRSPVVSTSGRQFGVRIDHRISSRHSLFGRYGFDSRDTKDPLGAANFSPKGNVSADDIHNAVISHTWLAAPERIVESSLAFNRFLSRPATWSGVDPYAYGWRFPSTEPTALGLPFVSVAGLFSVGDIQQSWTRLARNTYQVQSQMAWLRGRHSMKMGGELRQQQIYLVFPNRPNGDFLMNGTFTGNALADFLIGRTAQFRQGGGQPAKHFVGYHSALFFQNDWRIHPRLTLNLGLRHELPVPYYDKQDRMASFQPGKKSVVRPNAPEGLLYPGDPGVSRATIVTDRNNFAPRFGFAWDVRGDGRTSLRGGYGIAFDAVPGVAAFQNINVPPFNRFVQLTAPASFANPYEGLPSNPQTDPRLEFPCPCLVIGFSPDFRTPYAQNTSLSVQQQLTDNLLAEVSYIGTFGRKLAGYLEINPAIPGPGATLANTQQRRIYRDYNLVRPTFSRFNSHYHALQLRTEKRYSAGLIFSASYVYSKAIDYQSSLNFSGENRPQDAFTLRDVRGLAAFDVRHRFVASYAMEVPFPRSAARPARLVFGGWQLSGILAAQSGSPLTATEPTDLSLRGLNADRPDQISNPNTGPKRPEQWFDTAAFRRLPAVAGGQRPGTAGRNTIIGPGLVQTDLAAMKRFRAGEKGFAELRGEFFNALNHANFRDPGTNIGAPATFGVIQASRPARIVQLALKLGF